jgi:alkylhydroperoxidase family enzyme
MSMRARRARACPDTLRSSKLRSHGLDDEQILALNLVVAYFNFVNRIAARLGADPRPEEVASYRY